MCTLLTWAAAKQGTARCKYHWASGGVVLAHCGIILNLNYVPKKHRACIFHQINDFWSLESMCWASFLLVGMDLFMGQCQYHGCWCPGDARSQGIISHDMDLSHKSHIAPVPYLIMHHFVTEMCTFLLQNGALWDVCLMHCGICEIGLLT